MINEFRNRITVNTWSTTQSADMSNISNISNSYTLWAKVEDKRGKQNTAFQQDLRVYDYKITVRRYKQRPIVETQTITYNGLNLRIKSIVKDVEGKVETLILYCETITNVS